jgi:hypothetical protein|uniref:Uncharacterized protein n=1 Tax=Siphoviridae sp. ctHip2 TaxID=2827830 RepID=A0A8S5RWB6_9CAUD|nr:MAG TPA: hypothetical protein [Siphoviridae sp. ctHip2]
MTEKVKEYRILFNDEDTLTLDPSDLITSHFLEVNKTITNYTAKGETFKEDFICAEKALIVINIKKLIGKKTALSKDAYNRLTSCYDIVAFAIDYENSNNNKTLILPIEGENGINESQYITFDEEENEKVLKIYFN